MIALTHSFLHPLVWIEHFKIWIRRTRCQRGWGAFIKSGKIPAASVHMSTGMTPCYPSPLSAILIIRLLRTSFSSARIFLHTCLNATLHCGEVVDIRVETVTKWSTWENYFSADVHPKHKKFGLKLFGN